MENLDGFKGVFDAAFKYAEPKVDTIDGVPFLVMTDENGHAQMIEMEAKVSEHRDRPRRIRSDVTVRTPKSLAAYMNLYADANHMAFVKTSAPYSTRVILDYHEADDVNVPRWGSHTIKMEPQFSPAYAAWREHHRKACDQRDTMEFLEDRLVDVVRPEAADVMDMVMNFDGLTKVTFSQSQRLTDGRVQILYKEEEADSGKVTFYEKLELRVPVFEGAEPEPVTVRVRHRARDGKLAFTFVIANIEELERAAFERLCDVWRTSLPSSLALREVAV